ncbi:MAG: dihydrofolate reductase [Pseudomonadales bacterium]|jgi:dihydrofolate reductase|nr:dihydrofolate reductase [Pseudomonadales bacterium]
MIWAMAENRVIGRDNSLPWRLPNDMRHFMSTTMGKPVLMGRKTMASMKAPLPGRTNIVLTRDLNWQREGARVVHSLDDALALAEQQCLIDGQNELMVIGGADIYGLCLPLADKLYVTHVSGHPTGDVFFPDIDLDQWDCVSRVEHAADERHSADFVIAEYTRKP